jgi:hypothetical protein
MMLTAMLVGAGTGVSPAQDSPPDLRMLMNLDLFEPRHNGASGAAAPAAAPTDDSMLDQIQTLDQMGYLGNHNTAPANSATIPRAAAPAPGSEDVAPARAPQPMPQSAPAQMPQSAPSGDVEGPLP